MAQEAFAVIREAMRKEDLAGLARVVIYRREHLLLLRPRGKGLMATTLRYKNEVRDEKDYFDDIENIKVPADMLKLATHILDTKKGHFKPEKFEDRYEDALNELIKAKRAGKAPPTRRGAATEQRDQSDGCAAPQRQSRPAPAGIGAQERQPSQARDRTAQDEAGKLDGADYRWRG